MNQILNVKVNLSSLDLMRADCSRHLMRMMDEFEIPYDWIQFEITETVATEYNASLRKVVDEFTNAGIQLCLDDFGSGYANLSRILRLPFHVIKMDRSLLQGICESKKSAAIYHSVVDTLHNIGYQIVSEGVETAQEADLLAQWNVDMIQGYYYAKPQPENKVLRICNKPNT